MDTNPGRLARSHKERSPTLRVLGSPLLPLLLLMAVQWVLLDRESEFEPKQVNDTHTYVGVLQQETLSDVLSASRTLGYPLFLKLVSPLAPNFGFVPEAHTLVFFAAVIVVWLGARAYTGSTWLGFAFAAPMVFADLFSIVGRVQADFLSCALAVAALGMLAWSAGSPRRCVPVWLLALLVFAAYQTRPSYLFLIGFVPAIGAILWLFRHAFSWRGVVGWLAAVCLASGIPFLLFCALRWATVGHFGVVSYGGVNAIGIAVVLMDSEAVRNLPPEVKPLGERIYRKVRMGQDRVRPYPPNLGGAAYRYNRIVWRTSYPLAVEVVTEKGLEASGETQGQFDEPPSLVEVNQLLTDLSLAMFRSRPGRYLEWILESFGRTTKRVVRRPWIRIPGLLLIASILGLAFWRCVKFVLRRAPPAKVDGLGRAGLLAALGLALLGVGYYVCHLLLIVAVEIPLHRYTVSTTPLLAGSLTGLLAAFWSPVLFRTLSARERR